MSDALLLAVKGATDRNGTVYKSAVERHKDKPQQLVESSVRDDLANYITPEVMNEPTLKNTKNLMIRIGDAGGAMSFSGRAAPLVLMWADQVGSLEAVRRLRKLLSLKEASGFHVEAFAGLEIKSRTRLAHNVELIPFDQMPDSLQKSRLINRRFDYMEFGFMQGATAALMLKTKVTPLYHEADSRPVIVNPGFHRNVLNATRLCLALVGPRALVRLNGWYQYEDEFLDYVSGAGGMSYPSAPYHANFNIPALREFDSKRAARITKAYFRLSKNVREPITRAMERLDKAMCDRLPGDAAIDLSIALEALTTNSGGQGEHTWKVGLRSALLLGGDLESKEKTRRIVKEVYNYRSKVVHEGHIPPKDTASAISAVKEGTVTCAQTIERVVHRGRLPSDWSKFELSGGKAF